ncbi:hypothetical protein KIL84_002012 [Mauremys mutica]|uniref:Uncharacterized protein n=1 Tax=Mauremys mutica TaxID=74926 RepID=A0A9D4B4E8_9SAUR|nr:hypothetical protein KIL84_002012 [Mauremys mutica]
MPKNLALLATLSRGESPEGTLPCRWRSRVPAGARSVTPKGAGPSPSSLAFTPRPVAFPLRPAWPRDHVKAAGGIITTALASQPSLLRHRLSRALVLTGDLPAAASPRPRGIWRLNASWDARFRASCLC